MTDTTSDPESTASLRRMVIPNAVATKPNPDATAPPPSTDGYELDDRTEPPPIPNGWYAAVGSAELGPAEIRSTIAVARELVVYRDDGGEPHVVDAHCPHLGAHLGGGRVIDDTIRCAYHGWRFGPDGACVDIPYSEAKIPSRACLRTYPVVEQDGFVYFWYHAGGQPPTYEVPRLDEASDPAWSEPHVWTFELVAALQEMAENNVDYAHLRYVHHRPSVPDDTSEFTTEGPFSTVTEMLPGGQVFYRHTWGPGVAVLRVPDLMTVLTTTTPIDRRHCRLRWHFHFTGSAEAMADELVAGVTGEYGLQADVPIWRDKIFLERPLLVKADGNIAEFRRWYGQFYGTD